MSGSKIDFKNRKHIHFTGIKGVGQTALALCAKDLGIKISGSDVKDYFSTNETLKKAKIKYKTGIDPKNIDDSVDLLVTTAAFGGFKNPEYRYAQRKGIKAVSFAEALADLANSKRVITTVGIGGKTTTSAMLAHVFDYANMNPSYVVGVANIYPLGKPGGYDKKGDHFITEGDDYVVSPGVDNRAKFLLLNPEVVIISNIEHDHPDIYKNISDTFKTFKRLMQKIPSNGLLIACVDNRNTEKLIQNFKGPLKTFGFSKKADYVLSQFTMKNRESVFRVRNKDLNVSIILNVPGKYNALNATAAFIAAKHAGLSQGKIIRGLYGYKGCKRRFEYIGKYKGVEIVDDYAHHPKEIEVLIKTSAKWFKGKRVVIVFQPHTYSRTKALYKDFVSSLSKAEVLGIMDIYASAREKMDKSVSSEQLRNDIKKNNKNAFYTGDHKNTLEWIKKTIKKGDVLLTVGAGDVFYLHKSLIER